MNSHAERKEAIRKFKEIKLLRGTFAVKCTATGRIWVDSSRNLDATRNGLGSACASAAIRTCHCRRSGTLMGKLRLSIGYSRRSRMTRTRWHSRTCLRKRKSFGSRNCGLGLTSGKERLPSPGSARRDRRSAIAAGKSACATSGWRTRYGRLIGARRHPKRDV